MTSRALIGLHSFTSYEMAFTISTFVGLFSSSASLFGSGQPKKDILKAVKKKVIADERSALDSMKL